MGADEFLNPQCSPYFLDMYHVRASILAAVRDALPLFEGTVLDVGCGQMPYKALVTAPPSRATGYVGLDLKVNSHRTQPDLTWDGTTIPLADGVVEAALATEVLEHCPAPERVLAEVYRVLKPGGVLLLTVPFLWPLHDVPHDEYRYTPFALERILDKAGFEGIQLQGFGGWDASLAQMLGLWVRRRPMPEVARRILQRLVTPACRWLLGRDARPRRFADPVMITGLSAIARKPAPAPGW